MVDPYLELFTEKEKKDLILLLHDFTSIGTFINRYENAIDLLVHNNVPKFRAGDTVITTIHLNTPKIYNHLLCVLKNTPGLNWVNIAHDYMDQSVYTPKEVDRVIVFNKFQFYQQLIEGRLPNDVLLINPHSHFLKIPTVDQIYQYYHGLTGEEYNFLELNYNILFNVTSIFKDWIFKTQTNALKHLLKMDYRIFVKSYGFSLPEKLKWLEDTDNVYFCGEQANGPCGMPLVQSICGNVLGVECSALIEGLYYDNFPIFIRDPQRKLLLETGLFNWYVSDKKGAMPFPMSNIVNFNNARKDISAKMRATRFMKSFWLGPDKSLTKSKIKNFIFGED
jgi:hypothetical protein